MGEKKMTESERVTTNITKWMGTTTSIFIHSAFFIIIFLLVPILGLDKVLLVLTTAVSLEAIYLSLFIQMTVNRNTESLEDVEEDIEEIQEDVQNVEGDIDQIQDDVEDLGEEFEDISEDIEEIQGGKSEVHLSSSAMLQHIQKQLDVISTELATLRNEVKVKDK